MLQTHNVAFDPCRIPGEDLPVWIGTGLALLGATIAVVSAPDLQPPPAMLPAAQAAAVELAPPPAKVVTVIKTVVREVAAPALCFTAFTIPFQKNEAEAEPVATAAAASALQPWLAAHPNAIVTVEGHADSSGDEGRNIVLSFTRARAVAGLLAAQGIDATRLHIAAAGVTGITTTETGAASERRVVLRIDGLRDCGAANDAGGKS